MTGVWLIFKMGAGDAQRLNGVVEARRVSDAVHVTTDDGSAGEQGRVTDPLRRILSEGRSCWRGRNG